MLCLVKEVGKTPGDEYQDIHLENCNNSRSKERRISKKDIPESQQQFYNLFSNIFN